MNKLRSGFRGRLLLPAIFGLAVFAPAAPSLAEGTGTACQVKSIRLYPDQSAHPLSKDYFVFWNKQRGGFTSEEGTGQLGLELSLMLSFLSGRKDGDLTDLQAYSYPAPNGVCSQAFHPRFCEELETGVSGLISQEVLDTLPEGEGFLRERWGCADSAG